MNTLHAGLMCTLLLVGTIAGLFGCMSAVRCHRRFAFAICLAITLLDFVPLAVLLTVLLMTVLPLTVLLPGFPHCLPLQPVHRSRIIRRRPEPLLLLIPSMFFS